MATLPRTSKLAGPPDADSLFFPAPIVRPASEFDAGINTSAAWTEHLALSDDEPDDGADEDTHGRSARALFPFEGKPEFRELTVDAGDELVIVREDLADGWSLVKNSAGEVGLLPRTYYTFTSDFVAIPAASTKEASTGSITPRGSPSTPALAIVPQTTGEWRNAFPSFRQSLLGGKSLNRFSSFVTSGAEEWVLKGSTPDAPPGHAPEPSEVDDTGDDTARLSTLGTGEADRHFVDAGPAWKPKVPPFRVLVHSPAKRTSPLTGAYTIYSVTSLFHPTDEVDGAATQITVQRRFSHFVVLHTALTRRLPGIALPPLPEKQYAGRFSREFVEARRGDLERYITRLVRHPVARYAEVVTFFLGCESDTEWKRQLPHHLSLPPAGAGFYARVYHPAFNVDAEDAGEAAERFGVHVGGVGRGVQGLRGMFGRVREARVEMSKAERHLSYALLSLFTSTPLATGSELPEPERERGLVNGDGAWCWREGCEECLQLTKALQRTAETLQSTADLYDDHARRTQLATHEGLKGVAHPEAVYEPVITTHTSTLSRYKEATLGPPTADSEEMAARCETVLNTTMAEMETYHAQKAEDFRELVVEHLDGEIALYEQLAQRLRAARVCFTTPPSPPSPRQPSRYERELSAPRLTPPPLAQPTPHVYDSAPMRPVSAAIQGVLGGGGEGVRGSVFGRFW